LLIAFCLPAAQGIAQTDGETLFAQHCAMCHADPDNAEVPTREVLERFDPSTIVGALTDGNMRIQGQTLTPAERVTLAEHLTGKPVAKAVRSSGGQCERNAEPANGSAASAGDWNGWGPDVRNTRFQATTAGLDAAAIPRLELKWAFGIPNVTRSRSQPAVVAGRLYMASQAGAVVALDARTGCTFWTYQSKAEVRTAISVGAGDAPAVYFADAQAVVYALDAATGRELWSRKIDEHPAARASGSPTLYRDRLYVPLSGGAEENAAAMPDYECCTFRGSLTALDTATGNIVWKTYTVGEPKRRGTSSTGKPLWGPAGAPIWSAPTIDAKRGLVYAATGNAYADPAPKTSDSIIAFDLGNGKIRWSKQMEPDVWILGCGNTDPLGNKPAADAPRNPNCPEDVGPDFDFSASPVLTTTAAGKDILVLTQKAGLGYALDPDRRGKELWQYRWGKGSPVGGVWGASSDGARAYFAVADQLTPAPGGLHAVDLVTGERVWYAPPQPLVCKAGPGCSSAQSAAVTTIPGVVFSGSADGAMRAYDSASGKVIWTFDTNRDFTAVNGVAAHGGSIDGPGPIVAGGMLYLTAGNAGFVGTPGNVLLAFGPQ
jgi:polyvinyl alcohol dehydrogenase (cytochrome)